MTRTGFAMIAALFVTMLVSGFALDQALRSRAERRHTLNAVADLRARAAARAGVAHIVARLRVLQRRAAVLDQPPDGHADSWIRVDALAQDLGDVAVRDGSRYSVRVQDAASRLPLNDATEEELRLLFMALGADSREADVASQSILDWRDPDGLHRPRGAEWDDYYRHLSPPVVPRNGPFPRLEELRHVRGMAQLYGRAAEHLTILGDGRVNLNTAPEPVLRALPGLSDEVVAVILGRRAAGIPLRNLFELEPGLSAPARAVLQQSFAALARRTAFEPHALEIAASGWVQGTKIRRSVHALAVRTGSDIQVVWSVER